MKYKKESWLLAIQRNAARYSLLFLLTSSCVDKIDITYPLEANVLSIEGIVSDAGVTQISIQRSISSNRGVYSEPVKDCVVEIAVNGGVRTKLAETIPAGIYIPPSSFQGVVGSSYQLFFKTPDGKSYESSVEKLLPAPPIKKIYQQFNPTGQLTSDGKRVLYSTFDIFVDFDDNAAQTNYYLWDYKLYEKAYICITCDKGLLQGTNCVAVNSRGNPPTYDYVCQGNCWDILRSSDINILSDVYSNGKNIVGRSVAKVPFYSTESALLDLRQYAISKQAYEYYKLLRDQTQTTGTLTDTPPAAIVGNIKNVNDPNEKIAGIFSAVGTSQVKYVVERIDAKGGVQTTLLGRVPNLEPSVNLRPPLMPCIVGPTRTTFLPK